MFSPNKIVLVTGANKGIGFAIAKQLAELDKGYHVLIGSRDAQRGAAAASTLQKAGLSVESITIDVADDASIAAAVETVKSKFGRLDVLVNNSGILLDHDAQPTRAGFEQTFAVNAFGAAATTDAFIPLLEKSTSGSARIVFVSSDLGSLTYRADPAGRYNFYPATMYRSSKAAMNMIALGYAHTYREKGWKVNIHNPGYTKTDLNGNSGTGSVEDGARGAVRLATLGDDGETSTFSEREGPLPW